jgi:hypothetical protein
LGFIKNGAPEDEYDSLTARILSDILNKKGNQEIVNNAYELMTENYGVETDDSNIEEFKSKIEKLSEKIREKNVCNKDGYKK